MKKIITLVSFYFVLLSSCAGFGDKRNQYFVEGNFVGEEIVKDNTFIKNVATLSIKNISKEEFDAANGVDVVKDYNGGQNPYFSICFKVKDENDEYQDFHFYNLEILFAGSCLYTDLNEHSIAPCARLNKGIDTIVYTINHEIDDVDKNDFVYYVFYKNEE